VAVAIPWIAHAVGILLKRGSDPWWKSGLGVGTLLFLTIGGLLAIGYVRVEYLGDLNAASAGGISSFGNSKLIGAAFIGLNLVILAAATLCSYFAHDKDPLLEHLHRRTNKLNIAMREIEAKHNKKTYYCLNDVVITKGALARMIQCMICIDEKEIATLRSDGLIISTPTGSTAYSLAAGGPIIQPYIPAIILSPICPHTLSFRPMVVSSDSRIKIQLLTSGEEVFLTLDGQRGALMVQNDVVEIKSCDYELHLISSPKRNYFDLVQEKLGWAE